MNTSKQIIIVEYDQLWPAFFKEEAEKIRFVMRNNVIDIHHVGSTSVPGLASKPIIDMILVTNDLKKTKSYLINDELGYIYKGEYNLPLRDLYEKKSKYKIHLHVHKIGSPEITLNLLFKDFLRNNEKARKQYENVKIAASKTQKATEKVATGIPQYNLMKNDVIISILKQTGFNDLYARFVTQNTEHKVFNELRSEFFRSANITINARNSSNKVKKLVLYQGVEIIGAASLSGFETGKLSIDFLLTKTKEGFLKLLNVIEEWVKERTCT